MREKHFQDEWRDSWRAAFKDSHYIKIPDVGGTDARFIPKKPYDCYAVLDGRFIAMELKLKTKIGGFPFNAVSDWQFDNLCEVKWSGGLAYVVVNYRASAIPVKTMKNNGLKENHLNEVYVIEIGTFEKLDKTTNAKSLPLPRLQAASIRVEWRPGTPDGYWDLKKEHFIRK